MTTTAARNVTVGQTVTTIPSIGSGRVTSDTFTVTDFELFEIRGVEFVELHHEGGSHTMEADALVDTGARDRLIAWTAENSFYDAKVTAEIVDSYLGVGGPATEEAFTEFYNEMGY